MSSLSVVLWLDCLQIISRGCSISRLLLVGGDADGVCSKDLVSDCKLQTDIVACTVC